MITDMEILEVDTNGQSEFTIPEIEDYSSSFLIFGNALYNYEENYEIAGDTLTWSGPALVDGEFLYLFCNGSSEGCLFNNFTSATITEDGQTEIVLFDNIDSEVILILVGLTAYISAEEQFTITDNVLQWDGPALAKGTLLRIYY